MAGLKKVADEVVEAVKEEVEKVVKIVEVFLNSEDPTQLAGEHTVFTESGSINFTNGVANVNEDTAQQLKDSGVVK